MRNLIFILVILTVSAVPALTADWNILQDSPEPFTAQVISSDGEQTILHYQVNRYLTRPVDIQGNRYILLEKLRQESMIEEAGFPRLPRINRSIIIPDDGTMDYRILASDYIDIHDIDLAPSRGHFTRAIDPTSVPYTFGEIYQQDSFFPDKLVTLRDPYILRDVRGLVVELNAFQYNPISRTLRIYTDVTVEIEKSGPGGLNTLGLRAPESNFDRQFDKFYRNHFLNYSQMDYTHVYDVGGILVICYDDFLDDVQPYVDWKNQKGFPTILVPVSEAGSTAEAIKAYIRTIYNQDDIAFVLLVGDAAQVPTFPQADGSDPIYGLIVGNDGYPDIFVGRFSAENRSQVVTQVERTITYEKYPDPAGTWYAKGLGDADESGPTNDEQYDWQHITNIGNRLIHWNYTQMDSVYTTFGGTSQMISNYLNDGRSIFNYAGHGWVTGMGPVNFTNTDVNNLVNDNMLPHLVAIACDPGDFVGNTCFGEAWLRATNNSTGAPTGAIGTYLSRTSQSWFPPYDMQDEGIELLVRDSVETFGGMCFNGSGLMIDLFGSLGEWEFNNWTIFGDPALQLRSMTPYELTVQHEPEIEYLQQTFEVTVTGQEGALAALYFDGDLLGSAYTNAAGMAVIGITGQLPQGSYVTLTVTDYNSLPYIASLPVVTGGPDIWPPMISYDPLPNTTSPGPYTVEADILDFSGVASASLYYSTDGINYNEEAMTLVGGNLWSGDLPGQEVGTVVSYFIEAVDASPQANIGSSDTSSFQIFGVLFFDDMEAGVNDWTHSTVSPEWADQWHWSEASSHSGSHAWKCGDVGGGNYADSSHGILISPVITIGSDCELTFWSWIAAEASGSYPDSAYDGGLVEISFNGGAWNTLPAGYTHHSRATAGSSNPYTGPFTPATPLFSGTSNWSMKTADLSDYIGDIQLRFRFGSDANTNATGWYIDDVQIIGLPTGTTPDLTVDLTYVSGSPVPATGGNLNFEVFVENTGSSSANFDAWLDVSYEGGAPTTVIQRYLTGFQPGWTIDRPDAWFPVPEEYAAGNYMFYGRVGSHPAAVWAEDGFPFVKSGSHDGSFFRPFVPAQSFPDPFAVITGAEISSLEAVPDAWALGQNYPNPFNPLTTISFALPEAAQVKLTVYNVHGQVVTELLNGMKPAGFHEIFFDAAHLASGLYFYRIKADGFSAVKKMVLMK